MQKDRKDISRELREPVTVAKGLGAAVNVKDIISEHLEDVMDSIPVEEMASLWIYCKVVPGINGREMYSIGDGMFIDHKKASEQQLIGMIANMLERGKGIEATLEKLVEPTEIAFNFEIGKIETAEDRKARLIESAYEELGRRKTE